MKISILTYASLLMAIIFEVVGTSFLKQSNEFTRLLPTIMTAVCYVAAFYLLSISLREMPIGIAYAIWSGLGIVLISLSGLLIFKEKLDLPACIGLGFIIVGVVIVNFMSNSSAH